MLQLLICLLVKLEVVLLTLYFEIIFERELALLVALQGESSWKGGSGGGGDFHWKGATI